ncbi:methylated-DNA-protein-cysteine S-methyltransferase-like protein [Methylophaga frappieri]|uniref:Methylated-DNA-protein-cysteine S-methyltransferase-like protein n=1 Tax=Methylophaga frappieri (strain ATCC BAA-2434 / DSM 25690 / JAM7) TaxID=754477 RepID=I1YHV2_METFJ|nr:MGMT family protein [Methylophaga frappieri]AFJ02495.1 methylated-DNA-protein-cysteine S-methyltransferase-like protein [Methylophaga frappieri]
MTPIFDHIIWQLLAAVPSGKVTCYRDLAKQAGYPNHARQVGNILKNLPDGSHLPWHRVIRADGHLAFPVGSAAYQQQYQRLIQEGVRFTGNRVKLAEFRWH